MTRLFIRTKKKKIKVGDVTYDIRKFGDCPHCRDKDWSVVEDVEGKLHYEIMCNSCGFSGR